MRPRSSSARARHEAPKENLFADNKKKNLFLLSLAAILNRYRPKPFARYGRHLIDTYGEWMMDTFGIQLINDHGDFIIKKYGKFLWDTYGDYVLMTYGHEFMKNNFESLMDKYGEYMYDNFGKELTAWNHWIELKKKAEAASKAEL